MGSGCSVHCSPKDARHLGQESTAELEHSHQDPTDEHFGVVKFDYNLGKGGSTLMVRWSRDVSDTTISQSHPLFFETVGTETRYFTTQLQQLIGSGLMNTVRFAANRTGRDNDLLPTVEIPTSLYFSEDPHFGAISITNISTAGSVATIPVDYKQDLYQLSNTLTWMKGAHVVKTGFNWETISAIAMHAVLPAASIILAEIGAWALGMRGHEHQ